MVLLGGLFRVSGVDVLRVGQLRAINVHRFEEALRSNGDDLNFVGPIIADLKPAFGPHRPRCGFTLVLAELAAAAGDPSLYKIAPFVYGMVALSTRLRSIITCGYARVSPDIFL